MFEKVIGWIKHFWNDPIELWWAVQGWTRLGLHKIGLLRPAIVEMVKERKVKAQYCDQNGSCKACGCITPVMFYADRECRAEEFDEGPKCYEKR